MGTVGAGGQGARRGLADVGRILVEGGIDPPPDVVGYVADGQEARRSSAS